MVDLLLQYADWLNTIQQREVALTVLLSSVIAVVIPLFLLADLLFKTRWGPGTLFIILAAYVLWAWWAALFGQ